MEEVLREILSAGLAAADPREAVLRFLGDHILTGEENFPAERVFVLSVGKAAPAMARAAEEFLGERIEGGLVVTKEGHEASLETLETVVASHPEPDERSVEAARRVIEFLEPLGEGDLLLALVSGGASALLADPTPPIELKDFKQLTGALLRSGAHIGEINAVRKHVSVLKGGTLDEPAAPARVVALLLSDVVGDDLSSIASGLTAPDPTTLEDVSRIVRRYALELPRNIEDYLKDAPAETPKPGDAVFDRVMNILVGGGRLSAEAAATKALELGYAPLILSTYITGNARNVGALYAAVIREILDSGNPVTPPCALISGGEATVVVRGDGTGGPNQEFALALALELEGIENWAGFAVDTDGGDGPTDAAGGLVSGETAQAIRESGLDPEEALENNDAYAALEAAGALLITGPTGTNVNDLRVALVRGD
jgi:glycerate 2-kinase